MNCRACDYTREEEKYDWVEQKTYFQRGPRKGQLKHTNRTFQWTNPDESLKTPFVEIGSLNGYTLYACPVCETVRI